MLVVYVVFFGAITTLIAIKEELIEANRKMTIFFDAIDKEMEKNKDTAKKRSQKVLYDTTDIFLTEVNSLNTYLKIVVLGKF